MPRSRGRCLPGIADTAMFVTVAAGVLWAVAAFLWVKVLPADPDEVAEPA